MGSDIAQKPEDISQKRFDERHADSRAGRHRTGHRGQAARPPPRRDSPRCSPQRPGKPWCWRCWSTPSAQRSRCPRCSRSPSSPRTRLLPMPHAQLGAQVLTDPTPDGHPDPLNNAIAAAEAAIVASQRRTSLCCKVICPRCNRRSSPRRSPRPAATRAASSATGTAPARRRCSPSACRSNLGSAPIRLAAPSASGAIELTGAWPGLRCDIDTPDDLMVARRLGVGAATVQAIETKVNSA